MSLSIVEAEYIAAASCCSQILWMIQTLKDININVPQPVLILCDNTSAINISKNPVMHSRTKHIPIRYHSLREKALENEVALDYVASRDQVADIFTKPLAKEVFEQLREGLGVLSLATLR